jgi:hypothetical protein
VCVRMRARWTCEGEFLIQSTTKRMMMSSDDATRRHISNVGNAIFGIFTMDDDGGVSGKAKRGEAGLLYSLQQ